MNTTIRGILFGRTIANKLIKDTEGSVAVVTSQNIGDQTLALSFIQEYKKQNNISRIVYVTSDPNSAMVYYYRNQIDDVHVLNKEDISTLLKFYKSDLGQFYRNKHSSICCAFGTAYIRNDLLQKQRNLNFVDVEKSIFRIDPATKPCGIDKTKENFESIERFEKYIDSGKTVILNPYANSCKGISLDFYSRLNKVLKTHGYTVLCSVYGNQVPVEGTKGIEFNMIEAVPLFSKCGIVIGSRSGFLDLAAQTPTTVISIDSDDYLYSDYYCLSAWETEADISSYRWSPVKEEYIIEQVLNKLERKSK